MKVKGLILAGGEGKRIGGKKPLKLLSGKPLIFWALIPYLEENLDVFISVKEKTQEEEIKDILLKENIPFNKLQFLLDDQFCKGKGPLCGLYTGMKACKEFTYLLVSAVDQPFLTGKIFKPLLETAKNLGFKAVIYKIQDKVEPLPGVYPSKLKKNLEKFLATSSNPSFKGYLDYLNSQNLLVFLNYSLKIENGVFYFLNINSVKDIEAAEKCLFHLKKLKGL